MIRAVGASLEAGCNRLPVVVAKCARDARDQTSIVERAKRAIKRHLEPMIHSADDVLLERHATLFRGGWILPRKVLIGELYNGSRDNGGFAFPVDSDLFLFGDPR